MAMMQMMKGMMGCMSAMKGKGGGGGGKGGSSSSGGKSGRKYQPGDEPSAKVFVGGLKEDITEQDVRETMQTFGSLVEVKMMLDEMGKSRGYCFVTFEDKNAALAVYENYDNNMVKDQWVDCKPADRKSRDDDWTCPACGDLVFGFRTQCNMCGFGVPSGKPSKGGKKGGGKTKEGDWTCPNCGNNCFASKDVCKLCQTPKPESPDPAGGFTPY